ncbi:MAG: hypothetical protein ACR2L6_12525 [Gemmatimonadaceae bacterium]
MQSRADLRAFATSICVNVAVALTLAVTLRFGPPADSTPDSNRSGAFPKVGERVVFLQPWTARSAAVPPPSIHTEPVSRSAVRQPTLATPADGVGVLGPAAPSDSGDQLKVSAPVSRTDAMRHLKPAVPRQVRPSEFSLNSITKRWIAQYNDSVAFAHAHDRAGKGNWSVTVGAKRYGMGPGMLYLGNLSVPLPLQFAPPLGHLEVSRNAARQREDLLYQARMRSIDEEVRQAAAGVRERRRHDGLYHR